MPDNPSHPIRHETGDPHVRPLWFTALGLILFCGFTLVTVAWMFKTLDRRVKNSDRLAETGDVIPSVRSSQPGFPEPRLQVAPEIDLANLRAREDSELNSYGWIDRNAGILRIPIDRAMDLIAERGLPVQGQPGAPQPTRTSLDMQKARPLERETPNPIRTK